MAKIDALRVQVTRRAGGRCEYCRYPQIISGDVLHLEHIIPKDSGGSTDLDNLALSCSHCNRRKWTKIDGIHLQIGKRARLFHPRIDIWAEHFQLDRETGQIYGLTSIGRVTVEELGMNEPLVVNTRLKLIEFDLGSFQKQTFTFVILNEVKDLYSSMTRDSSLSLRMTRNLLKIT